MKPVSRKELRNNAKNADVARADEAGCYACIWEAIEKHGAGTEEAAAAFRKWQAAAKRLCTAAKRAAGLPRRKQKKAAGAMSLRAAAKLVSKALKEAKLSQGSITAQGLRKWISKGCSPHDAKLIYAPQCGVKVFPVSLDRLAVFRWCDALIKAVWAEREV